MAQNALWREDFGKKGCLHFSYKNILLKYSKNMKRSPNRWHGPFHPLKKLIFSIINTYILYYFTCLAGFNANYPISPMCDHRRVPICMPNIDPGDTCTGWNCCKHRNGTLRCRRPVDLVTEGGCIIDRNHHCYIVNCLCDEMDSVDRSTTTISSMQGVDSVDRSTSTTELKKQNHPHKQR